MSRPRSIPNEQVSDVSLAVGPEPKGLSYGIIRDEGKRQVLVQRAQQLEAEHYNHSLNRKIMEAQIDSPGARQQIEQAKAAMIAIEAALAVVVSEITAMEPEGVDDE